MLNKLKTKRLLTLVVSLLFFLLAACNNGAQENNVNENANISSLSTDSNSGNYPHTKPVKVQEAKYEFKILRGNNGENSQAQQQENMQEQGNTQNQTSRQDQIQNNNQKQNLNNVQQQTAKDTQTKANEQQHQKQQAETPQKSQGNQSISEFVASVIELTNAERSKQGLPALQTDSPLNDVAKTKAQDMASEGYFSHTSPTYGSPFDMMRDFGISYQSAAENIAAGQRSPEEVVNAWMNSEGHRANILDNRFTHIGVGFDKNGNQWVQMFIKK